MRGKGNPQSTILAFVNLDERVPPDHPLEVYLWPSKAWSL